IEISRDTVEVIHEALIHHWERLRSWMATHRDFRAWQDRLREDLIQWEMRQKDSEFLLQGVHLKLAEEWLAKNQEEISLTEVGYIEASISHRIQEETQKHI